MSRASVVDIGQGRRYLDLGFRDTEGLVASYFLPQEDGWSVIETGPESCRGRFLQGLEEAGIDPTEVRRVFVTHIHLDHSGGLGALADSLPNASFYAHREGVAHLVDPSRLVASARRAWGPGADTVWGSVLPVNPLRLHPLSGGEVFPVNGGRLEVLDTPGHARHHLAFFDSAIGGLMTGDAAGVLLSGGWRPRPAVPPPDLDLEKLFQSLDRMAAKGPRRVLLSHFGESPQGARGLSTYRAVVEEWRDVALEVARTDPDVSRISRALREHEESAARASGRASPSDEAGELISGYDLAAQGLLRYLKVRRLIPE